MDPFLVFRDAVQSNFLKLKKSSTLFYKEIDRDLIWSEYLKGFSDPLEKSEHTCNACKSFLRQAAGIVIIKDNEVVSIWDGINIPEYEDSLKNLRDYLNLLPITDVFVSDQNRCGIPKNADRVRNLVWNHLSLDFPSDLVIKNNIDSYRADKRDNKNLLKRALTELTIDATETVLELIGQKSLYKGDEFKTLLSQFLNVQKAFKQAVDKDLFCWSNSVVLSPGICRIRNTAIGTLLIDLSENLELDIAVSKYEKVVAPSNYKRPTALITPTMIRQAQEKLVELDLVGSLDRRFATEADLNIENILFTDKVSKSTDIFTALVQDVKVSPQTFSKVDKVSIEEFLSNVLPFSKTVEVLFENGHLGNLVTLLTAQDPDSNNMFKWSNKFSWCYTGGVTDSIKENVAKAGGKVDAVLRASLQWNESKNNCIDFDLHALEPGTNGSHIYYNSFKGSSRTSMSGNLDVDMINPPGIGIENITWSELRLMKNGDYVISVHNFSSNTSRGGFSVEVEFNGESHVFEYPNSLRGSQRIEVATVTLNKGEFSITSSLTGNTKTISKDKWNISTNQFIPVEKILLSPNFWDNQTIGNKHYFFMLKGCKIDEQIRPVFNEFIKPELDPHRKVFEVLGSKLVVPDSQDQLSGLGFSSTKKNRIYMKVDGKFKRTIEVTF